jgi:hypothetical protein
MRTILILLATIMSFADTAASEQFDWRWRFDDGPYLAVIADERCSDTHACWRDELVFQCEYASPGMIGVIVARQTEGEMIAGSEAAFSLIIDAVTYPISIRPSRDEVFFDGLIEGELRADSPLFDSLSEARQLTLAIDGLKVAFSVVGLAEAAPVFVEACRADRKSVV